MFFEVDTGSVLSGVCWSPALRRACQARISDGCFQFGSAFAEEAMAMPLASAEGSGQVLPSSATVFFEVDTGAVLSGEGWWSPALRRACQARISDGCFQFGRASAEEAIGMSLAS